MVVMDCSLLSYPRQTVVVAVGRTVSDAGQKGRDIEQANARVAQNTGIRNLSTRSHGRFLRLSSLVQFSCNRNQECKAGGNQSTGFGRSGLGVPDLIRVPIGAGGQDDGIEKGCGISGGGKEQDSGSAIDIAGDGLFQLACYIERLRRVCGGR